MNYYSWLYKSVTDSSPFKEEDHPRESKGERGGQFRTSNETVKKQDFLDSKKDLDASRPSEKNIAPEKKEKPQHYRDRRDALADKMKDDGTYDLDTGEPVSFDDGYQVSFQEETTEREGHSAYKDTDEYDRLVIALSKELNAQPNLAKFGEPELSFHVSSLEKALEVARRHNQESIFDWSTFECIPNPDFVGRTHYADRNNHTGKNYRG